MHTLFAISAANFDILAFRGIAIFNYFVIHLTEEVFGLTISFTIEKLKYSTIINSRLVLALALALINRNQQQSKAINFVIISIFFHMRKTRSENSQSHRNFNNPSIMVPTWYHQFIIMHVPKSIAICHTKRNKILTPFGTFKKKIYLNFDLSEKN